MSEQRQTTKMTVTGMTCDHCVASVTEELDNVQGVREVRVELNAGGDSPVFVDSDGPLDIEAARAAVVEAGYTATF
jgi:copper chaperone CopZ